MIYIYPLNINFFLLSFINTFVNKKNVINIKNKLSIFINLFFLV